MTHAAAHMARAEADEVSEQTGVPRCVAGAIGPTNKTLSLSPDVNDPGFRAIEFDELKDVYREQIEALLDGGVDFILIETIFDTLNAKAGIMAVIEAGEARGTEIPLMLSMTLTDMSGRNLRSEEHTSELQSLMRISYAVFCLKKKKANKIELRITVTQ